MARSVKLCDDCYLDTDSISFKGNRNYNFSQLITDVLTHYNNTNTYWCRIADLNAVPDLNKFAFYYYDAGTKNIPSDFAPYGVLVHIPCAFNKQLLIGNWANSSGNYIKVRTRVGADVGGDGTWDAWYDLCDRGRDTGWKNITTFYNGAGYWSTNHTPPRYKRVGNRVYLEGLFAHGTSDVVQFNIPAGYRPKYPYTNFAVRCGKGIATLCINTATVNGDVLIQNIYDNGGSAETSIGAITYETGDAFPS